MKPLILLSCVLCASMAPTIAAEPPPAQSLLKDTAFAEGFGAAFIYGRKDVSTLGAEPNFVVIFTDDQGWADLGCQGVRDDLKTPHLDALAATGARLRRTTPCIGDSGNKPRSALATGSSSTSVTGLTSSLT